MKTVPISKDNNADGHVCQCDSHGASKGSEKDESSGGCGCGGNHSHEGHSHDGHECNHGAHGDHHHDGHECCHN